MEYCIVGITFFRDTRREAPLEWNTSEISASTSVFDITQNESGELNYTVMSELAFGSNVDSGSGSPVPTQDSILADALATWEHLNQEFIQEDVTSSEKLVKEKKSSSKGRKRRHKLSKVLKESSLSEASENSINYSAIQSAILLPQLNQVYTNQGESSFKQVPNAALNNTSLKLDTSTINQTSIQLPQINNQGGSERDHMSQTSFSSSGSGDTSSSSDSHINSSYLALQNSALATDSISTQTVGESHPPLINSTQAGKRKSTGKRKSNTLPTLPEERRAKIINVPPKEEVKKTAAKGAAKTKTKTKGTQVNIKVTAPRKKAAPKKTTEKKVVRKRMAGNKKENNETIEPSSRENTMLENDLNINLGDASVSQIKPKEVLLKEKVEGLLNMTTTSQAVPDINMPTTSQAVPDINMPTTSQAVPDINNSMGTIDLTLGNSSLDQTGSEVLVSQSCSIEIIQDANRINIILPPKTNLSLSKNKSAKAESKKKSPAHRVKKNSLSAENNTPKEREIKIKKEKLSPKSPNDVAPEAGQRKTESEKEDFKDKKIHSRKSDIPKTEKNKHEKAKSPHRPRKQKIACGYMSPGSSDESDDSYDSSDGSSSCSCSDCVSYCSCSFCEHSTSCSCSDCSESSYESCHRRRYRR